MRPLILPMLAALAACSTTPEQQEQAVAAQAETQGKLAAELAGLTPGEPIACLPEPARTQEATAAFGPTLVYRVTRNVKYRNDTLGGCERLSRGDILVSRTPTGRTCRGDILRTLDPVSRFDTGSCTLGNFVPYRRQ